jgi:ubiquinone biosynthesis monooxygenase Coq6
VVWARSVGLEVINELETIKAALIMTAGGGRGSRAGGEAWRWDLVAKSLENFNSATDAAKVVGSGLGNMVGIGLQQLGDALTRTSRR